MAGEQLRHMVDLTTVAVGLVDGPEGDAWRFARCWLLINRFRHHDGPDSDAEQAMADFSALADDFPGRAKLAQVILNCLIGRGQLRPIERVRRASAIWRIAEADPQPLPEWPKTSAAVRSMTVVAEVVDSAPGMTAESALAELDQLAVRVGTEQPMCDIVTIARDFVRGQLDNERGIFGNDHPASEDSVPPIRPVLPRNESAAERSRRSMNVMMELQAAMRRYDIGRAISLWSTVRELAEAPDADPTLRRMYVELNPMMASAVQIMDRGAYAPGARQSVVVPELDTSSFPILPETGMSSGERGARIALQATVKLAEGTAEATDQAIGMLRDVVELIGPEDRHRPLYLTNLGSAEIDRHVRTRDRRDLTAGLEHLEEARAAMKSVTDANWALVSIPLYHAYQLTGRIELAIDTALDGLRGHTWAALINHTAEDVQAAVRGAADDARSAMWLCLTVHDAERAVTALELGRGLILYSALETRDLTTRLADAGQPQLAEHWQQSVAVNPAVLPEDLRRRVMGTLTGVTLTADGSADAQPRQGRTHLLDPPASHEVRAALRAFGADALVYLVPGESGSGVAVIVAADDPPRHLFLPDLRVGALAAFDRFLADTAQAAQRGDPVDREARVRRRPTQSLDDLCEWAWRVAIGPLLNELGQLGRPVRLVLVPSAELARVPWHAARDERGGYALDRAVFSYAASARLMCESAFRPAVDVGRGGLVVADPETSGAAADLPAARAEATAIARDFYPDARLVGRDAEGIRARDGAGSRADVLRWFADEHGGAVAHFACHGVVRPGHNAEGTSYLLLAGGDRLTAEDLLAALSTSPGRSVALAVLAACNSAETGRGYDESFSIASAFLAANVRSVISAQWSVPDASTSMLMYMLHHFLAAGAGAVDALHAAQRWVLHDRTPPESMPAELRRHLGSPELTQVLSWAGFIHSGQ